MNNPINNPLLDEVDPDAELEGLEFQPLPATSAATPGISTSNQFKPAPSIQEQQQNQKQSQAPHVSISIEESSGSNDSSKKQYPFWTIGFYKCYFEIQSSDIFRRIMAVLLPREYLFDIIREDTGADLYGPVWIATTFVMLASVVVALRNAFDIRNKSGFHFDLDQIGITAAVCYSYISIVPLICFLLLKYLVLPSNAAISENNSDPRAQSYQKLTLVEVIDTFGYCLVIWGVCLIASVFPSETLKWLVGLVGLIWTCLVFLRNYYPLFSSTIQASQKARQLSTGTIVLIGMFGCWVGFYICFGVLMLKQQQ